MMLSGWLPLYFRHLRSSVVLRLWVVLSLSGYCDSRPVPVVRTDDCQWLVYIRDADHGILLITGNLKGNAELRRIVIEK
jgi:hypothetical protein